MIHTDSVRNSTYYNLHVAVNYVVERGWFPILKKMQSLKLESNKQWTRYGRKRETYQMHPLQRIQWFLKVPRLFWFTAAFTSDSSCPSSEKPGRSQVHFKVSVFGSCELKSSNITFIYARNSSLPASHKQCYRLGGHSLISRQSQPEPNASEAQPRICRKDLYTFLNPASSARPLLLSISSPQVRSHFTLPN